MINRRDLLKIAGLGGLSFSTESFAHSLNSFESNFTQSYPSLFLNIHADGGWDPTCFCDPKGQRFKTQANPVNHYMIDDIRSPNASSPIRWAPLGKNDHFFQIHYDKVLVINGVDTSTDHHSIGTQYSSSGQLEEGHPSFAAMLTACQGRHLPLGYITNGSYNLTRGVVPKTHLASLGVATGIAKYDFKQEHLFYSESATGMEDVRNVCLESLQELKLPGTNQSLNDIYLSQNGQNQLKHLHKNLPNLNHFTTHLGQQGAIAIAGYRSDLTIAAHLSVNGFDTHSNHDVGQTVAFDRLSSGLSEIWTEVERHKLQDRVLIMVTSDFGRTPYYNESNGKDHWPITSVLFMGAGIRGNRVIGATDESLNALPININTLELDPNGVKLTPAHLHACLRQYYGIEQSTLSAQFPICEPALPIFS